MFGYPNSTGFDGGPCTTTVGCGSLSDALELSIKNPTSLTPYDYCDVDGGAITGNQVQGCLQCIQADGEHDYMSNCTWYKPIYLYQPSLYITNPGC